MIGLWLSYMLASLAALLGVAVADARGWLPGTRERATRAVVLAGLWPLLLVVLACWAFGRGYAGLVRFLTPIPRPRRNRRRRPGDPYRSTPTPDHLHATWRVTSGGWR